MNTTIFNTLSHTDFLRLTLEAFSRQGFEVEQSSDAGADAVLVSKSGTRIAVLCKKYRGAFIGRPVLQQFHAAMGRIGCREGYLITTTDCSPEAHEFAKGKRLELFNRDRTTRLFLTTFGDEFMRTGRIPELGQKAKAIPAPAHKPVSAATYEKIAVSDRKTPLAIISACKSSGSGTKPPLPCGNCLSPTLHVDTIEFLASRRVRLAGARISVSIGMELNPNKRSLP